MKRSITALVAGALLAASFAALAGPGAIEGVEKQPVNVSAIAMFLVFVVATLGITKWAAGKTKSTADFYTAGGGITGFQNGLAIAGDYMSAATLLGLTSMVYFKGYDGFILILAFTPKSLGASLSGGVTTLGMPVGVLIILSAFVLTGIYVRRANTEFDQLNQEIVEESK